MYYVIIMICFVSFVVKKKLQIKRILNEREAFNEVHNQTTLSIQQMQEEFAEILLKVIESRDPELAKHSLRVGEYSYQIALSLNINKTKANQIKVAAILHDIGKITIPENILQKVEEFDDDEWKTIKTHCQSGYLILKSQYSYLLDLSATIALQHHERPNGEGYPNGLDNEEIALEAKIISVADAFDAITFDRCYQKAKPLEEALRILNDEKGKHFDIEVVDAFMRCIDSIEKIMIKNQEKVA